MAHDYSRCIQKSGFLSELKRSGSPSPNSETAQEDDWSENPGYEKVNILTDSTIEKYFSTHESSLVMFYTTCKYFGKNACHVFAISHIALCSR